MVVAIDWVNPSEDVLEASRVGYQDGLNEREKEIFDLEQEVAKLHELAVELDEWKKAAESYEGLYSRSLKSLEKMNRFVDGVRAALIISKPCGEGGHTEEIFAAINGKYRRAVASGGGDPYVDGFDLVSELSLRLRAEMEKSEALFQTVKRYEMLLAQRVYQVDVVGEPPDSVVNMKCIQCEKCGEDVGDDDSVNE